MRPPHSSRCFNVRGAGIKFRAICMVVLAVAAVAVAAAPAGAQAGGFGDVAEGTYYSVPVEALAELGLFAGTECAEGFCPDDPIDRKTMATWVVRVLDGADPPAVSESRFDDVDAGGFHAPFIERLAELGVTGGCGDGSGFCPDQTVSRAEMAVFLTRAYGLSAGADPGFVDVAGDAWYAAAVSSLAASAITGGCGDGSGFCPQDDTSRAQMATFIHRAENRAAAAASIEITPIGRGVSVTSEGQILVELEAADVVPANPLDLAGKTLLFTPDGQSGYSRSVHSLAWEEDIGSPEEDNAEIELPFLFRFSGQDWRSLFLSRYGLVTFDEPYPFPRTGPDRWGTMSQIAAHIGSLNAISALYKPRLGGWSTWDAREAGNTQHVSRRPDRVVITWITEDHEFYVHGRPHAEKTRFQMVLHADGHIAFNYAAEPENSEEAIRDGIVGLFPEATQTELIARIPDSTDLSRPVSRSSWAQHEVFHHVHPKDHLIPLACRIIDALGDEFDLLVFHSQFRTDHQFNGSWWGYYPGNVPIKGIGQEEHHDRKSSCSARMRGQWNFPIWVKSRYVANLDGGGEYLASPKGLWHFGHEFAHTWAASVGYLKNGEREPLHDGAHWVTELHTAAPYPWEEEPQGSIIGGHFWRENSDGTFTPSTGLGGLSWLDLYLAGLATPDEVPEMFILRNLQEAGGGWRGPHTGEKEVISIEQIIAAEGPRDPPAARSQKTFNAGFVYLTLPGEPPDPDLLELHALFVDGAVAYWRHVTGGRGSLTTELVLSEGS
ncbi:MAG: S-layer homology domain-containing protein [Acidimicrobiaceae bacterium]|nr:S-layer homology domain-containing protein [Acidimicrobiaceae bacterium]MYE08246.1 S-layer homology domain-containing protein [Acidimicrobiaceae bacterium]MYI37072.1 S-layer homology domain-containing protein [Acidimicrobiaceae bacterium]